MIFLSGPPVATLANRLRNKKYSEKDHSKWSRMMCSLLVSGDVRCTGVVLRMSLRCFRGHLNRHLPDTAKHTPRTAGCSDDSNTDIIRTLLPCRFRSESSSCLGAPVATQCRVTFKKRISQPTSPQRRPSRQRCFSKRLSKRCKNFTIGKSLLFSFRRYAQSSFGTRLRLTWWIWVRHIKCRLRRYIILTAKNIRLPYTF
jgi:hypothetical protein